MLFRSLFELPAASMYTREGTDMPRQRVRGVLHELPELPVSERTERARTIPRFNCKATSRSEQCSRLSSGGICGIFRRRA